jgi:hypothetical protein
MPMSQGAEQGQDEPNAKSSESSRWLLAQQRLRESGIPPAHERIWATPTIAAQADDHIESALAECTRAEANLGSLIRGLSHLTAGANAAREANTTLLNELDTMRELLGRSNEYELSLRLRVQGLEQALEASERDAALSRALLIEQEDLFLAELLSDHQHEVLTLQRRLADVQSAGARALEAGPPSVEGALESAPPQITAPRRTELQDDIDSLEELALDAGELHPLEEDEERESGVVPISTLPPPPDFQGDTGAELAPVSTLPPPPSMEAKKIGALVLRTISVGALPATRTPASAPAESAAPATAEAPEEAPPPSMSALETPVSRPDSKPALRMKPDPSTRPLVGYSLGSDEVAEERIDTSRLGRPSDS